jgi:NitT/TauT family transport system substrate-binding protein
MKKNVGEEKMRRRIAPILSAVTALAALALPGPLSRPARAADHVKIGTSHISGYPGVPVALARGYFAQQGIDAEIVFFESAQPISVGVASGDIDFGVSGMSAGFYNLASQGQLRLIASSSRDMPGFFSLVAVAGDKAWQAGLKSPKDLPGHTIGVTQIGTALHFSIGMIASKYDFPMTAVTVKPLQSNPNVMSALLGGTIDAAVLPVSPVQPAIGKGEVHVLAWMGDVARSSSGAALFTSTKTANERGDLIRRFLIAYRQGLRDFHDAFADESDHRRDGPLAATILPVMAAFTRVSAEEFDRATPFSDPQGRLDPIDIDQQIAWYKGQGLLKAEVKAGDIVDPHYAIIMPHNEATAAK